MTSFFIHLMDEHVLSWKCQSLLLQAVRVDSQEASIIPFSRAGKRLPDNEKGTSHTFQGIQISTASHSKTGHVFLQVVGGTKRQVRVLLIRSVQGSLAKWLVGSFIANDYL